MKKIALLIIVLLCTSASLSASKPKLTDETKSLLKDAKAQTKSISHKELKLRLKEGKVILLDVRDPDEWKKGSINYDKQVQISRGFLEIKYPKLILQKYSKEDTFILYCALEPRSVLAAKTLQELGFKHVLYLEGGVKRLIKNSGCKLPKRQPIVR